MQTERDRIQAALQTALEALAFDRECLPEDMSQGVIRALENFGLECVRIGKEIAYEAGAPWDDATTPVMVRRADEVITAPYPTSSLPTKKSQR